MKDLNAVERERERDGEQDEKEGKDLTERERTERWRKLVRFID